VPDDRVAELVSLSVPIVLGVVVLAVLPAAGAARGAAGDAET
jgi:hypothetical protein